MYQAANILLTGSLDPVVSDFGLTKLVNYDYTHDGAGFRGTLGHIAPGMLFSVTVPVGSTHAGTPESRVSTACYAGPWDMPLTEWSLEMLAKALWPWLALRLAGAHMLFI